MTTSLASGVCVIENIHNKLKASELQIIYKKILTFFTVLGK